jgi:hypothetical protein
MAKARGPMTKRAWAWMITRWACLLLLPPIAAILTGFAAVKHGQTRALFVIGLILTALILAFLQVYSEIQAWSANKSAVSATVALAQALNKAGRPLVNMLGKVAHAPAGADRRADVNSLIIRTVGIAHSQCGWLTGSKPATRSVFYQFVSPDRLVRVYEEGRQGRAARKDFVQSRTDNDRRVIELAQGEDSFLFPDLDNAPPRDYASYPEREYNCMLMVPVRTDVRSYGFLSVDADKANSLTDADRGYVVLMAGLLASAIALLGEEFPQLTREYNVPQIPSQGGQSTQSQQGAVT